MNEKTGAAEKSGEDRLGPPGRASQRRWSWEALDLPSAGGLLAASPDGEGRGLQGLRSSKWPGTGIWLERESQLLDESSMESILQ